MGRICRGLWGTVHWLVFTAILLHGFDAHTQGTFESNSTGPADWDVNTNWTLISGSDADGVPDADDDVTILTGHTRNVNVASNCNDLTINTGGILRHSSNVTLTVGNDFTMNGTAAVTPSANSNNRILDVTGTFNVSSGATASIGGIQINITGNTSIDGSLTLDHNTGVKTFIGSVTLNAGGAWTSTAVTANDRLIFQNGIVNNGTSFTAGDATFNTNAQGISGSTSVSFANDVTITGVTLTNNLVSPDAVSITLDLQGTGGFTQGTNALVNIGDDANTIGTFTASASPNTVVYNTDRASFMACPVSGTYHHLTIDKTASVNSDITCSTTVNGDLTISGGNLRSDDNAVYTNTVNGSTLISSGVIAATYNIRNNSSVLNMQDLTLDDGTITGGNATSNVTVATTFDVDGTSNTINGCNFTVTGATSIDGTIVFGNNNGIKTFGQLVSINAGGSWTSTSVSNVANMVFQNGIDHNGTLFSAGGGTFDTNSQSVDGSVSVTFANDITITGVTLTNDLVSPDELTIGDDLLGTGGITQGTNAILNIADDVDATITMTASASPNIVRYNSNPGSTMACPVANTYHHLIVDKGATNNTDLPCDLTINGDFTISGGNVRSDVNAGALTHTVAGSTLIESSSSAATYNIRDNSSVLNVQDLTLDGSTITGGNASSNVNIATTFSTTGSGSTINGCNLTITGTSTLDAGITFGNNNGIKSFGGLVTINAGGSWNSNSISTASNLVFQNGITNNGSSYTANSATFNTNAQNISGSTTLSFSNDFVVTGVNLTNDGSVDITNGAAGALTGTGNWIQGTNGSLDYSGQTLTVASFDATATGNTVNYNRGGAQTLFDPTSSQYYNLSVSTSGIKTLPANLTILNDLTIDGTADLDASANTVDLNVAGNWTNNGTFTQGTQSVVLNGTAAAQTIGGTTATTFYDLTLNNTSGMSPEFILGNSLTAQNMLTMTEGLIDLAANSITIGTAAATPGTLSHTSGHMYGGDLIRYYDAATIADGNVAGLFPLGNGTNNRFFYITAPSVAPTTGGTVTISYTNSQSATTVSVMDDVEIVRRHEAFWTVATGGGMAGGTYNLRAIGSGMNNIQEVDDLRMMLSASVVGSPGTNGGTVADPEINRTGLSLAELTNSFHVGSVDGVNSPLPVDLLDFYAQSRDQRIDIHWSTASETNNAFFSLERSFDGLEFEFIAELTGSGNSNSVRHYKFSDHDDLPSVVYYRLRQTDFDGNSELFKIVQVRKPYELKIFPNPISNGVFNLTKSNEFDDFSNIEVMSIDGKVVPIQINETSTRTTVTLSSEVVPGIYLLLVHNQGKLLKERIIVRS